MLHVPLALGSTRKMLNIFSNSQSSLQTLSHFAFLITLIIYLILYVIYYLIYICLLDPSSVSLPVVSVFFTIKVFCVHVCFEFFFIHNSRVYVVVIVKPFDTNFGLNKKQ